MKILVLAGGSDQIALINELHKHQHEVILADYFLNPPAKPFADKHVVISTLNTEAIKQLAISEKVDLITTACTDQALLTVAKVSEELSLPCYISYQTALNVTNKAYMKQVMVKNKIPTAKFLITNSCDLSAIEELKFPLVIKPVDCNSSKGVKKVQAMEEVKSVLQEAIELSRTKTAIIEEFQEGIEISADFFIEKGIVKLLSVTGSYKIQNSKSFTILQSCYPVISPQNEDKIRNIGIQIAKAFNLDNCPLLLQLINKDDYFSVLEFSARMGGGSKYKLIQALSGVDIMKAYVDLILGDVPAVCPQKQVNYALMNYIYCIPGTLKKIVHLDSLYTENIIDAYFQYKTEGMQILKAETSGDRPGGFLITAETMEELKQKLENADNSIQVFDTLDNDIMIHRLYSTQLIKEC